MLHMGCRSPRSTTHVEWLTARRCCRAAWARTGIRRLPKLPRYAPRATSVGHGLAPGSRAGDDRLHDLRGAVADLEAEHVAQSLLHRPAVVSAVPEAEQALMDRVVGQLRRPPLAHRRLGAVRQPLILEPQRLVAQQAGGF